MALHLKRLASLASLARSFHSTPTANEMTAYEKFNFKASIYRKYGLLHDDLLNEFHPVVKEAVDRLPEEMRMGRVYRSIRASQLFIAHSVLPENEWSKIDDDHNYLQPYIDEIEAEIKERDEWERSH